MEKLKKQITAHWSLNKTTMNTIPTELVIKIIEYLNYVDIVNLGLVNRWFNQIYESNDVTNILADKYYRTMGTRVICGWPNRKYHETRSTKEIYYSRGFTPSFKICRYRTKPLCHKLVLEFLKRGLVHTSNIQFGNIDDKYLIKYCNYALYSDQYTKQYWVKKLAKSKLNKHIRNNYFQQFFRSDPQVLNKIINYDCVLLFALENNIEPLITECNIKTKGHYNIDNICDTFTSIELLSWIMGISYATRERIVNRIFQLKNYDMMELFLDRTSPSLERKRKSYIKWFYPVCYPQYEKLFETHRAYILTRFINIEMGYLANVIGTRYSPSDIYYLYLLQPHNDFNRLHNHETKCLYKCESNNPAVKLANAVLHNKVLDNDSIELLSKIQFTYQNKEDMIKFLIHMFKYDVIKCSGTFYKRMYMVNVLLKIIENDISNVFWPSVTIIHEICNFGFGDGNHFKGVLLRDEIYIAMKKEIAYFVEVGQH